MLLFLFGLPLAVSVLFNMAIGRPPQGLRVGVINREVPHGISDCYLIKDHGCNLTMPLGCRLVKMLAAKGILLVMIYIAEYLYTFSRHCSQLVVHTRAVYFP